MLNEERIQKSPIPMGGFLVFSIIFMTVLTGRGFVGPWEQVTSPHDGFLIGAGYLGMVIGFYWPIHRNGGLGAYLKRNVIGYVEWFFTDRAPEVRLRTEPNTFHTGIGLPLGGWFSRPRMWNADEYRNGYWKIRRYQQHMDDNHSIRVQAGNSSVILDDVEDALRLIREGKWGSFGAILMAYVKEASQYRQDADRQKKRADMWEQLAWEWEQLARDTFSEFQRTVNRIGRTRRYKPHSKEAQKIHADGEEMIRVLAERFGDTPDPEAESAV